MSDSPRKPFGHGKSSGSAPKPAPRPVPQFEVIEDEPDDGFEVVDEAPKKAMPAPKKAKRPEPEPELVEPEEDEPEREKPRKKKKKKKLDDLSRQLLAAEEEDEARRAESLRHFEYTIPSVLFVIGLVLSIVGAFAVSKGVSGIYTFMVLCVFVCIYAPLSLGALMVVGVMMSINYGRLAPAILKMSAITFTVNGIWLIGEWMHLPYFLIAPISCFISYGVFMTMFDLDTAETGTSTGVLNIMTFIANVVLITFLVVAEASSSGGGKTDTEEDGAPAREEKKRDRDMKPLDPNAPPPPVMPDEDN